MITPCTASVFEFDVSVLIRIVGTNPKIARAWVSQCRWLTKGKFCTKCRERSAKMFRTRRAMTRENRKWKNIASVSKSSWSSDGCEKSDRGWEELWSFLLSVISTRNLGLVIVFRNNEAPNFSNFFLVLKFSKRQMSTCFCPIHNKRSKEIGIVHCGLKRIFFTPFWELLHKTWSCSSGSRRFCFCEGPWHSTDKQEMSYLVIASAKIVYCYLLFLAEDCSTLRTYTLRCLDDEERIKGLAKNQKGSCLWHMGVVPFQQFCALLPQRAAYVSLWYWSVFLKVCLCPPTHPNPGNIFLGSSRSFEQLLFLGLSESPCRRPEK